MIQGNLSFLHREYASHTLPSIYYKYMLITLRRNKTIDNNRVTAWLFILSDELDITETINDNTSGDWVEVDQHERHINVLRTTSSRIFFDVICKNICKVGIVGVDAGGE
jgi:hypothetical protein